MATRSILARTRNPFQNVDVRVEEELDMVKRVSLVRRRPGMTQAEFVTHWAGPHVEIVRQMPGVLGLRLGVVEAWTPSEAAWDGVGEIWFESVEAAARAFAAEPYASMLADDRRLFLGEGQSCFVTERTIVRPPGDA
jgi:uncharacterized protein (TIGR02118 family)